MEVSYDISAVGGIERTVEISILMICDEPKATGTEGGSRVIAHDIHGNVLIDGDRLHNI
jgi:hypothetical protein